MKTNEAWNELYSWLDQKANFWYGKSLPKISKIFETIMNKMDELEMKYE